MKSAFTLLDWSLLLVLLISLILGIMKGLARELFSLGFLILGVALAFRLYLPLSGLLQPRIGNMTVVRFLAFVAILLAVVGIGIAVTWLVKKMFVHGALSLLDRLLGGGLGAVRGFLLCCVLLAAIFRLPDGERWINRSTLAPGLFSSIRFLARLLPQRIEKNFIRYLYHDKQENSRNRGTI